MKKSLELQTIKEYCKKNSISDSGVRKQIKENKLVSLVYNDLTYIVIETVEKEKLKSDIKLLRQKNKTLEQERQYYINQSEKIEKLESKVEKLEDKLEVQRDTKEQLYEKVIGQLLLPNKD